MLETNDGNPFEQSVHISSGMEMKLLSTEVQEIISNKPVWIVRNGILLFLLIILLLVGISFFISYPDIVQTNASIISINTPKEVTIRTDGKLIKLYAIEGKLIKKGELLGLIESRANHNEVLSLLISIDTLQKIMESGNKENISKYFSSTFKNLGEVQPAFQTFIGSFNLYNQYLENGYYLKRRNMLKADIGYLQRLHTNLLQQKVMQQEDVNLAQQTLDANKSLEAERVISSFDYRLEKSKYIGKALSLPQIDATIINNESNQHEKLKEIAQIENEIATQKEIFIQSINTLKSVLEDWKSKYLLISPIEGKIQFSDFLQENQQLKNGQRLCFINPENTQYFAKLLIPQNNFGKIKTGQKVFLKLPAYPHNEFGAIIGRLDFISNIPSDSGYIAKVVLPKGLETNYARKLKYQDGLFASGEIITADTKLSDRLFNQFRYLFSPNK